MKIDNITQHIGFTPLVRINGLNLRKGVAIYAKLEGQNPGGSVKDRAALSMIKGALDRGDIQQGSHIVEATSGNTGIALAMIARQFGLKMTLIMPSNATVERVDTMRAFGAEVILTPAEKTIEFSREYADKLVREKGYFLLDQFGNDDNWKAHFNTTGPEIWKDTEGQVSHFVSAMGTTGTIMGVSKFLKTKKSTIQVIGVQPKEDSSIPGIRRWSPAYLPAIYDAKYIDRTMDVDREEAISSMKWLAQSESIFSGLSAGGAFAIARQVAQDLDSGVVVFVCPDQGSRYLSSWVWS